VKEARHKFIQTLFKSSKLKTWHQLSLVKSNFIVRLFKKLKAIL